MIGTVKITWESKDKIEPELIQALNREIDSLGSKPLIEIQPNEFQLTIPLYTDPPMGDDALKQFIYNTFAEAFILIVTKANEVLYLIPADDEEEPEYYCAETWLEFLPVTYSQKTKSYHVPECDLKVESWYDPEAYGQQRLIGI